ncbi:MAG: GldM family protein [Bacteroidota bacterium]
MKKLKVNSLLLPLIIFLSQNCFGQKYDIDSLFKEFKLDIHDEQYMHGDVVWDDETRTTYYTLLDNCSIDTLIKYTDDSNAAVRSYMYLGLLQKNADEKILKKILRKHKKDKANFSVSPTDVLLQYTVKGFMEMHFKFKTDKHLYIPDYKTQIESIRKEHSNGFSFIAGEHHGLINKNDLLLADSLNCDFKNFKIVSFTMTITKDTTYCSEESLGNHISATMKEKINEAKNGSKIWFEDIKVANVSGEIRNRGTRYLRIKQ